MKMAILAKICQRFDEGNDLGRRAPLKAANLAKTANLAKMANLVKLCHRVSRQQMSWPKGPRRKRRIWRKQQIGENGEFGENFPKGLTKANELAQRARGKRRIWRKRQNLAKLCQRV